MTRRHKDPFFWSDVWEWVIGAALTIIFIAVVIAALWFLSDAYVGDGGDGSFY